MAAMQIQTASEGDIASVIIKDFARMGTPPAESLGLPLRVRAKKRDLSMSEKHTVLLFHKMDIDIYAFGGNISRLLTNRYTGAVSQLSN